MDADEYRLLRESLRSLFTEYAAAPEGLSAAVRELGWEDVVAEEPSAASLLFEEQGRSLAVSGLLDEIVLAALGIDPAGPDAGAVVYPLGPRSAESGPTMPVDNRQMRLDGVLRTSGGAAERVLVPCATDAGIALFSIPTAVLAPHAVGGLDPEGGWSRISGVVALDDVKPLPAATWPEAVAAGRRALAAELVGVARATLDLAITHVTDRHQFGRPIGAFQAVRFRLAEVKVAIEAAAEAVRLAYAQDPDPLASAVAKALAGDAADLAVRQAAQVCGAVGSTWEFPLHRLIRRSFALDLVLGHAEGLRTELGRMVVRSAVTPQLDPLVLDPAS